jgi:cobalt-zinc-cadmium efflux system membrane fusion protein
MASETSTESAAPGSDPLTTHAQDTNNGPVPAPAPRPAPGRRGRFVKVTFVVVVVIAAAAAVIVRGPKHAEADARGFINRAYHFVAGPEHKSPPHLAETKPPRKASGYVEVVPDQREALGMQIVTVKAQTESLQLELTGTTDFDQNTLAKVRPLFDARVTQVFKSTGQIVKKGDPLVEIYSTTMAAAKADYRTKYGQWVHDKKLVESRRQLALDKQISNVQWVDTLVTELTSRVNYLAAEDKLITYGIPPEEIRRLRVDLMDEVKEVEAGKDIDKEKAHLADMQDISKLTIRAPIDGMIVERDVVSGNFYDDMAVLMVISPMEKLWVWGNVYEKDQDQVHLHQSWAIYFPYLDNMKIEGRVEHISAKVDPNTRTLKIRASIPNPKKELKAEQLVKAVLNIPPMPGHTVIPRNALVVINGVNCCFVQMPNDPDKFQSRKVEVDQENHDFVVIRSGLAPGEKVVTNGSLILAQLYEDESTVDSGMPLQ